MYNSKTDRINILKNQLASATVKERKTFKVLVTGAAGQIGYVLCFMIAQGKLLNDHDVILHLFDLPMAAESLKGVEMELFDGAFPRLKEIVTTTDPKVAFKDIDIGIFVGARPRGPGMERKDLLSLNGKIFQEQGKYLDTYAKKSVKVLVVGNPANTNCLVLMKNAPSIPAENFSALTRLDQNRAIGQVSAKLKIDNERIRNIAVWGNHSATQFPDLTYAVYDSEKGPQSIPALIANDEWIDKEFIPTVQKRGAAIIAARKLSSAASAASAAVDHVRDWVLGTEEGKWTSMAVISKGEYGAPEDVIFSFPVTCRNGEWKIVENLKINDWQKEKITITGKELIEEREMALN